MKPNNYWKDRYGKSHFFGNKDFIAGIIAGIEAFAWWKDGIEYVGTGNRTKKEAIQEVIFDLGENSK